MELIRERLYYTIGEVSRILDINPSTIRYWEKHFSVLRPVKRKSTSKRKFDLGDIQALFKIKTLLKDDKMPIRSAGDYLKDWKPSASFDEFNEILKESKRVPFLISADKKDTIINLIGDLKDLLRHIK